VYNAGLMQGNVAAKTFDPQGLINRAQMATLLSRIQTKGNWGASFALKKSPMTF